MYRDTITLFNRVRGRDGDTWLPVILRGVNINIDKGAIKKLYGDTAEDNCILNIRFVPEDKVPAGWHAVGDVTDADGGFFVPWESGDNIDGGGFNPWDTNTFKGNMRYRPPKEWQALAEKGDFITFTSGNAFDFFWVGEWHGSRTISDDNYGDLSFYDYMLSNYDFVFAITSVSYFTVIPHFEITGR